MKPKIVAVLLALSLIFTPTPTIATSPSKAIQPLSSVIMVLPGVEARTNVCTTSRLKGARNLFLTAAHCVDVKDPKRLYWIGDHEARPVVVDVPRDLAVFEVPTAILVQGFAWAEVGPKVGDATHITGYPLGLQTPQTFFGHVSSVLAIAEDGNLYMTFGMSACMGHSGSAVLNAEDQIIGVLTIAYNMPCSSFTGGPTWNQIQDFRVMLEALGF